MCVAMVIIHTKTLEKKAVDDVRSQEPLPPHEPPAMSRALLSCGIMESGRWPQGGVCGSSLESLWDGVCETSGLLRDMSLSEASSASSAAPPSKRQCRSLSCSEALGSPSPWQPQGSRVWTAVEKRRCYSGGSVQRSAFAPAGFPSMHRSSSFSLSEPLGFPSQTCSPESRGSTPEPRRRQGLSRSRSQPCVHNEKKSGVKRRRPADSHTHRPSLDLLKMTQLQDFHSLHCPGLSADDQTLPSDVTPDRPISTEDSLISQSEASWAGSKELWAGLCNMRGRDLFQLGGELDIEQIERN
ncbi:protein FAM53B isoform X2 [Siphateles boraxobius]|uniref:protein FAM53B isoform X2 n=1 Tax=Siphateles boraxobius TaxID=180520 RepID=UPI004063A1CA